MNKFILSLVTASLSFAASGNGQQVYTNFQEPQPYQEPKQYQQPEQQMGRDQQFQSNQQMGRINWLSSYSDAVSQSRSQSKPIVILFTGTSWCPACIKLEREVLNKPEFANAIGNRFIFLKAEFADYSDEGMRTSPYKSLMERYRVDAFPTFIVVDSSGQKLYTVNYQAGGPGAYVREFLQKLRSN